MAGSGYGPHVTRSQLEAWAQEEAERRQQQKVLVGHENPAPAEPEWVTTPCAFPPTLPGSTTMVPRRSQDKQRRDSGDKEPRQGKGRDCDAETRTSGATLSTQHRARSPSGC